jgi:hypothetical protein
MPYDMFGNYVPEGDPTAYNDPNAPGNPYGGGANPPTNVGPGTGQPPPFTPGQAGDPAYDANPRDYVANRDKGQWRANLVDYLVNTKKLKQADAERMAGDEVSGVENAFRNERNIGIDPARLIEDAKRRLDARIGNTPSGGNEAPPPSTTNNPPGQTYGNDVQGTRDIFTNASPNNSGIRTSDGNTRSVDFDTNTQRRDDLYKLLHERATQSTSLSPDDPAIKQQLDAFRSEQERSKRNYISDNAERSGPYANTRGETRMANEQVGQQNSAFQAQLMSRELTQRRDEIQQALSGLSGQLTSDQQANLQRELGLLDNSIRMQSLASSDALGNRGLDIQSLLGNRNADTDLLRAMMQNQQFYSDLGLRGENQFNYWNDPMRGSATK